MNVLLKYCLMLGLLIPSYLMIAQNPSGLASMYDDKFQDSKTASGERYDKDKMTAAHRSLPFGSKVKVTRLDNKKSVIVTINDRGPFVKGYVIDLSRKAAEAIGLKAGSSTKVKVERVGKGAVVSKTDAPSRTKDVVRRGTPKGYDKPAKPRKKKVHLTGNVNPTGLYKVQTLPQPKRGFGIQVALFTELDHLVKRTSILGKKGFKNVLVLIDRDRGKLRYKIILGPFKSQAQASAYKRSLKKNYGISGFTVNLAK